jgi:hypothetical protein
MRQFVGWVEGRFGTYDDRQMVAPKPNIFYFRLMWVSLCFYCFVTVFSHAQPTHI